MRHSRLTNLPGFVVLLAALWRTHLWCLFGAPGHPTLGSRCHQSQGVHCQRQRICSRDGVEPGGRLVHQDIVVNICYCIKNLLWWGSSSSIVCHLCTTHSGLCMHIELLSNWVFAVNKCHVLAVGLLESTPCCIELLSRESHPNSLVPSFRTASKSVLPPS